MIGMLEVREMRFPYANGLVVLRSCAPLEGAFGFVGSNVYISLTFFYI